MGGLVFQPKNLSWARQSTQTLGAPARPAEVLGSREDSIMKPTLTDRTGGITICSTFSFSNTTGQS